jgi:imidazolonepropionase-like amidohydrolase
MKTMHKRGIRVLPGGDYGFAWTPHGTNAMDLEYFVRYFGFTPMEAIVSATKLGAEIMMKPGELGHREGRARSPTCCWWTATRSPTSRSCATARGCSRS